MKEKAFRVEFVSNKPERGYVIVRQLEEFSFALSEHPVLGGAPIVRAVTQPRAKKPDGTLDHSLYVFQFVTSADAATFSVGQEVRLQP